MKTKITAKKLKSPDKLLKAMLEFFGYLKHNVKLYLTLAAAIVLITAIVVSVNYFNNRTEEKAREKLYALGQRIQMANPEAPAAVAKMIEDELPNLGSTRSRFEAQYMLAEIYYNMKDWDKAISNYETVSKKGKGIIRELALLGEGYSRENKGDVKGALDSFMELKDKQGAVYKAVAMLGAARCYHKLGDKNNAMAVYESVIIAYPETDFARLASASKAEL